MELFCFHNSLCDDGFLSLLIKAPGFLETCNDEMSHGSAPSF